MKALFLAFHDHRSAVLLIAMLFIGCTVGSTSSLMKDLDNANATRLARKYGDAGYGWIPYEYVLKNIAMDFWSLLNIGWIASAIVCE